jgi:hypothetical protein
VHYIFFKQLHKKPSFASKFLLDIKTLKTKVLKIFRVFSLQCAAPVKKSAQMRDGIPLRRR